MKLVIPADQRGGANTEKVCREPDMSTSSLWQTATTSVQRRDFVVCYSCRGNGAMGTRLFSFLFARHKLREELWGTQQQQQH